MRSWRSTYAAVREPLHRARHIMSQGNGSELPILIAGGGIGGLAAAYALALKGLPVRVFEQAPEFKEIGAGIQLGPNIFRALEKIGLKGAVLADAHRPPGMETALEITISRLASAAATHRRSCSVVCCWRDMRALPPCGQITPERQLCPILGQPPRRRGLCEAARF